jgi:hypothetical protein
MTNTDRMFLTRKDTDTLEVLVFTESGELSYRYCESFKKLSDQRVQWCNRRAANAPHACGRYVILRVNKLAAS